MEHLENIILLIFSLKYNNSQNNKKEKSLEDRININHPNFTERDNKLNKK